LYVIQGLLGSLGRPINIGYFPLNKGIITEKQQNPQPFKISSSDMRGRL
jgi:hypothetical protein